MAWIYLVIAGIFEIVWAIGLKYTEGFTKVVPSLITLVGMAISFYFFQWRLKPCRLVPHMQSGQELELQGQLY